MGSEAKLTGLPDTRKGRSVPLPASSASVSRTQGLPVQLHRLCTAQLHGKPSAQTTVHTGLPVIVWAAALIPLTSGPQPQSSLNTAACGQVLLCSDSGCGSGPRPRPAASSR